MEAWEIMSATAVGAMNFNVLRNIIKQGQVLKLNRGAEIGVLYGDTSAYLLEEFPNLTLYSVDPYLAYDGYDEDRSQSSLNQYEAIAHQKLAPFGMRAQLLKEFSLDAAKRFTDSSLDFVFIDANHNYEHAKEDMAAWYPKVRGDGLFCGHDYRWSGVNQAVHEFAMEKGLRGFFTPQDSDIWFFVKP